LPAPFRARSFFQKNFRIAGFQNSITLRAFVSALFSPQKKHGFGLAGRQNAWLMSHSFAQGARRKTEKGDGKMTSKNEKGQTAAEVCEERLADIGALLDQIGQEIKGTRDNYSAEDGFDWELAGDLGRVRARMVEALAAFGALFESDIEATLAELRG
jgi:hypothetical protein